MKFIFDEFHRFVITLECLLSDHSAPTRLKETSDTFSTQTYVTNEDRLDSTQ